MKVLWNMLAGIMALVGLGCSGSLLAESPATINGATTVDTFQARQLYGNGAIFVDVRNRKKWRLGHIEGSHHFGLRTTFGLLKHQGFIERARSVVIYDDGAHTMRAALASYMAVAWGYTEVYFYRDGYFSWLASDLPVNFVGQESGLEAAIFQRGTN